MRGRAALTAFLLALPLGGCIAAALPVVAAGVMARDELRSGKSDAARVDTEEPIARVAASAAVPVTDRTGAVVILRADEDALPPAGPGDYAPFARYASELQRRREAGEAITSAVLVRNFAIERPDYVECGVRPPAVIVDLDPASGGPDPLLFAAAPDRIINPSLGLAARLADLREAGVAVLWLTDHPADMVTAIAETLRTAGLDPEGADRIHAEPPGGGRKQERRIDLASAWCVLAIAGDAKSDAEEAYDYLRSPDAALMIDQRWESGWFLVPPPLVAFATPTAPETPAPAEEAAQ